MSGIIARKLEMTRVIRNGRFVPVTILKVPSLKLVQKKTVEVDGYEAAVLEATDGKRTILREVPLSGKLAEITQGDMVSLEILDGVEEFTLHGISKGKGFAGAMKRYNFSGGPASHGSKFHRALGSIGNRKPRRTKPGKKMHGHMGTDRITLKNVPLVLVNKELSVIAVKWPVPGARNSYVTFDF